MRYVIIGNGTAAVGCVEGIRSIDRESEIVIVSKEKHPAYCRPLISYYLEKKTTLDKMNYRPADFYEKNGCQVLYGVSAAGIDNDKKTVTLDDGSEIEYSSMCVASGSSPFVPPFDGLDSVENKCSFMTMDDSLAIEKAITPDSRVLIVGAGLIGLKCAEGLYGRVGSITVCDLAERVLSSILDDECAALMQGELEEKGIEFLLGDTAVRFEKNTAFMKSGKTVTFDILVLAVGVRANTSLVKDSGGEVNRGIIVNNRMETSLSGVYAAGDCAEGEDISSGTKKVLAIMPNAYMQGHCAGVNMAGGEEIFDKAIPMNSIGFFSMHAMTAGSYEGELYEEKKEKSIRRLYIKDGLLKGFMLVGVSERAGIYTSLIREKTPLSTVDLGLLAKTAALTAFSSEKRGKMFGGVV